MLNFSTAIKNTDIDLNECNKICLLARFRDKKPLHGFLVKLKNDLKTEGAKNLAEAIVNENYNPAKREIAFLSEHIKTWADNRKEQYK